MTSRSLVLPSLLSFALMVGTANASSHTSAGWGPRPRGAGGVVQGAGGVVHGGGGMVMFQGGAGSGHRHGGPIFVGVPWVWSWGPVGMVPYMPPIVVVAPGGYFPASPAGPAVSPRALAEGLGAMRPVSVPGARPSPLQAQQQPKRGDPARASQLITLGDRFFRSGNLKRATERYEQALHASPDTAAPRVRLAQVALVRGQYAEAANRIREAQAAEPGWLINAPDIQAIYAEPRDFAAPIAKLETHLQVEPTDRDAWLVLGAQWYLSGRTRQAADVFSRLTDRQVDPTLTAFLDATTPSARH